MKKISDKVIVLLVIFLQSFNPALAQDEEQPEELQYPYMEFSYLKNTDDQRILEAKVFLAGELGIIPIKGLTVKFFTNREEPELLGESSTNEKGVARYVIPDESEIPTDEDNYWWFYAEFEGNDKYDMAMEETTVMDVNLEMELQESEDGKIIILKAFTTVDGEEVPVSDEDIFIFVPRMFSLLPVAEGYFIDGIAEVDFPDDVPGDSEGNLTVIGRFDQHWQFGNVEKRENTKWGVPSSHEVAESHRALWTQIAPRWMIITLSIMLAGVWGHYLYAIISMIRINKIGKKLD